jgi:hypothetical protein
MKMLHLKGLILLAACLSAAWQVQATTVYGVRYGIHKDFDRVVFELSAPVNCTIETVDSLHLRVHLGSIEVGQEFRVSSVPKKTVSIRSMRASGGGKAPFVLDICLHTSGKSRVLKFGGTPHRVAVDITPIQTAQSPQEEPTYIPGDRPYPTRFAETPAASGDSDNAKISAILAYYFASMGDSVKAREEAKAYQKATGQSLNLTIEPSPFTVPPSPHILFPWLKVDYIIAFFAGMLGYFVSILLSLIAGSWTRRHPRDQAESLSAFARKIRKTCDQAPPPQSESAAKTESAKERRDSTPPKAAQPEALELEEVQKIKDSAAERRVQRVVQLAEQGKTLADIAQELEMSQDEVKLILDLNR